MSLGPNGVFTSHWPSEIRTLHLAVNGEEEIWEGHYMAEGKYCSNGGSRMKDEESVKEVIFFLKNLCSFMVTGL